MTPPLATRRLGARARQTAARQAGDPTWLAHTVYGNPHATISHLRP
jgi:hypothetical protein